MPHCCLLQSNSGGSILPLQISCTWRSASVIPRVRPTVAMLCNSCPSVRPLVCWPWNEVRSSTLLMHCCPDEGDGMCTTDQQKYGLKSMVQGFFFCYLKGAKCAGASYWYCCCLCCITAGNSINIFPHHCCINSMCSYSEGLSALPHKDVANDWIRTQSYSAVLVGIEDWETEEAEAPLAADH